MTRHSMIRALLLASALLALGSCKKSNTAADAAAEDATASTPSQAQDSTQGTTGVRLLDKGQRPREELRYNIAAGTTASSTTTFRVTTLATVKDAAVASVQPGLRLDIVSGPAELTDRGVKYNVEVVKSEALVPNGFDEDMAELLRAGAAIVDGVGGWVEVDDRGRILAGDFSEQTKRSDVPVRLVRMIVNTRETLTRVRLPEEKVGPGARWESRHMVKAYGFNVQQVNTYTLVDRADDEVMLNVEVQQFATPQTIEFPEEGIKVSVESMTAAATGQIILNLNALESDASGHGTGEDRIFVTTPEGTETVDITEEFQVQVANTSAMPDD